VSLKQSLIDCNTSALKEGIEFLALLGDEQYQQGFKPAFQSTIGAHFRHLIEHYRCFFNQRKDGLISYDLRERDQRLEEDKEFAAQSIEEIIQQILALKQPDFEKQYFVQDQLCCDPIETTLQRELLFLQSHTTHHFAMIAAMSRGIGADPQDDFGVAIATRVFAQEGSQVLEKKACAQ